MPFNPSEMTLPNTATQAKGNVAGAQGTNSGDAQKAIETQNLTGIPASAAMYNPVLMNDTVKAQQTNEAIDNSPGLQTYASRSGAHAASVLDDIHDVGSLANYVKDSFLQPVQNMIQMGSQRMEEKQAELKGQPWYSALGIQAAQVPKDLETAYGIVGNAWSVLTNWAAKPLGEVAGAAFPKVRTGTATEDAGPFVDQRGMLDADDPRNYVNDKERSQENYQNAFNALFGMFNFGSIFSRVGKEIGPVAEAAEGLKPAPAGGTGKVPLNTEGLHPIDENGMVVDANGNAYRFENARQAAKWQMDNVTHTATGQQFNPHFDADTGTFTIREAPKAAPEGEPPAPGITPEADEVHKELTGLNLQRIQGLQEKVAASNVLKDSPTALTQLLNDSGLDGETVSVNPHDLLSIMQAHEDAGKSVYKLSEELWHAHSDAMNAGIQNDTSVQVPLADYISATAGQPWAADLNNAVSYGAGWSPNDINDLAQVKAESPGVSAAKALAETAKGVAKAATEAGGIEKLPSEEGPFTMEHVHQGGSFYFPGSGDILHVAPTSPEEEWAPTKMHGYPDTFQDHKSDVLNTLNVNQAHKVIPAAEPPKVEGILPENQAALKTLAAKIDNATQIVMKERALDQLFTQPKALETSKPMYEKWANKVESAFQRAKEKAFNRILNRITKEYRDQWNESYKRNIAESAQDVLSSRGMAVQHALRFTSKEDVSELTKDNEFVRDGKPVHFWHASDVMGLGSKPEDYEKWGLADSGIDPNFKTMNYPVISFAESREFAKGWRTGVQYIVHLKSRPSEVGDFRRPADLKKATEWYEKTQGHVPHGMSHGAYSPWENRKMMDANGWNAIRMVEGYKHPDPPNVGILHGHQVYVRYMMPQYMFHPDLGVKYEDLPADIQAQFTPDEFHEQQRYFKGKFADSGEMSVNTKIDVKDKALYKELLEHLPSNIWGKGGISADKVALQFGYSSGEEMLKEIAEMEMDRKAAGGAGFRKWVQDTIREQARQRTLDEVGNLLDPEKILNDTRAAFNEPSITGLLEEQLQALANERGLPFNVGDIKADTLEKFQQMPMRDAKNVKKWERDLQKSNKDMERGLIGDKPIPAFEAKQRVLQATYRLQAAHEARRLADRGARLIRDLKKLSAVDKMDPNFAAVIQKHVQDLHLGGRRNPIELARYLDQAKFKDATDLVGFLREMGSEMELATVPDAFRGINEEQLTWDKFTGMINLQDFESNINMLTALNKEGRRWNSIVKGNEVVEMNKVAEEVEANATFMGGGAGGKSVDAATEQRRNMWQRMAAPVRGYMAMHTRVDILLRMMDKAERGILTKTISDPLQAGKYTETKLTREYDKAMTEFEGAQDVYQSMTSPVAMPKWMQSDLDKYPTWINNRGELLRAAANLGTSLNMKKLFGGYGLPEQVWPHAERWILDQLRPEEETFLKVHWAQFQKIFPLVDKAYMDDRGYGLKKEEGRDVAFKSGTVTGGYVPLNYDRRLTIMMKAQKGTDTVIEPDIKTVGRSARKLPGNGFTKERTNYVGPISMSSMIFRYAASEAIHDLAFRAPLRQATKLLDPDASTAGAMISQAVSDVLGPEYMNQLIPWLDYIATEHLVMHAATDDVVRHGKAIINNMAYAHIAGQIHSPLRHGVAGGIHAITEAKGDVVTLSRALAMSFDPYWRQRMNEMSEEIAGLSYTQDPVLRDAMSRIPYGGSWVDKAKYLGTTFFRMFKNTEARATWTTRFLQETQKHGDSTEAILSANQAARDSQGAGHAVDQPAAARTAHTAEGLLGYGLNRFLTFLNTSFNRTQMALHELKIARYRGSQGDKEGLGYALKGAAGLTGYILAPAFVGAAIVALLEGHRDPKDSLLVAYLKEAGWGVGENTIGTTGMGNQILAGLHPGESTGGVFGAYIENITSVINHWGQPAETRKALQAAGEPFGLWDSIPREVQNVVDLVHPENLKKGETDLMETIQRLLAMRNARYESQRRGRRGMGGGIRGGLR